MGIGFGGGYCWVGFVAFRVSSLPEVSITFRCLVCLFSLDYLIDILFGIDLKFWNVFKVLLMTYLSHIYIIDNYRKNRIK